MKNRYAVFFDRQKILFTGRLSGEQAAQYSIIEKHIDWGSFMNFIRSGIGAMACISDNPEARFIEFSAMFRKIEAAGGLVADPTNHWLFIYRRDRWDLPKGMLDPGETPEQAALREIEEECAIGGLRIIHQLDPTYHVYPLNGNNAWALKKTYWFFLRTRICCQAEPQTSEGITRAEWKNPGMLDDVFSNTYGNIKEMLFTCRDLHNA